MKHFINCLFVVICVFFLMGCEPIDNKLISEKIKKMTGYDFGVIGDDAVQANFSTYKPKLSFVTIVFRPHKTLYEDLSKQCISISKFNFKNYTFVKDRDSIWLNAGLEFSPTCIDIGNHENHHYELFFNQGYVLFRYKELKNQIKSKGSPKKLK